MPPFFVFNIQKIAPFIADQITSLQNRSSKPIDAANLIDENAAPTQEEIDEANNIVEEGPPSNEAVLDAEDALLAHYKSDLPGSEDPGMRLSEEEQEVVDAIRGANPSDEVIEEALEVQVDEDEDEDEDEDDVTIDTAIEGAISNDGLEKDEIASNG